MIPTKHYRGVKVETPLLNLLTDNPYMEKIAIKTIYPQWSGESISQIAESHPNNPFVLRIGTPIMDKQMSSDTVYLMAKYMAYNPTAKQIEARNLIDSRFLKKVYVGEQTITEMSHKDYGLFVNGSVVAKDVLLLETKESLVDKVRSLEKQMRYMQTEIAKIAKQVDMETIYNSNELIK